jgi:hypothetical protein
MFDAYAAQILDYYTHRVDPKTDRPGREYAELWDREFAIEGHPIRELAIEMQRTFAGRDVLELAAGLGRWSRPLLATANSLLATDSSPRVLERLPDAASWNLNLPSSKFRCEKLDAFHPEQAAGKFNGALTVNWFQHMPKRMIRHWIARLHKKLLPGSVVMIAMNHLAPRARCRLFSKPRDPNLYAPRYTFDGRRIEVIDNVYSEPDLRAMFKPFAKDFCFFCDSQHYWITYEPVPSSRRRGRMTVPAKLSKSY